LYGFRQLAEQSGDVISFYTRYAEFTLAAQVTTLPARQMRLVSLDHLCSPLVNLLQKLTVVPKNDHKGRLS